MISAWLDAAMRRARYWKNYDEDGNFDGIIGKIDECRIVIAEGDTLESCREELLSCLEDWVLAGIEMGKPIPEFDGIALPAKLECELEPLVNA